MATRLETHYLLALPETKVAYRQTAISRNGNEPPLVAPFPWVTQVVWNLTPASRVTPNLEGIAIERRGLRLGNVVLSGEVGFLRVDKKASAPSEWRLQHETVDYLKAILDICEYAVSPDGPGYLLLYAFDEGEVWQVVPDRWSLPRNASNRLGISWQLRLILLGMAKPVEPLPAISTLDAMDKGLTWAQKVAKWIDWVRDKISVAKAIAATIQEQISNVEYVIRQAELFLSDLQELANQVTSFAHAPARIYRRIAGVIMSNVAFFWRDWALGLYRFIGEDYGGFRDAGAVWALPDDHPDVALPPRSSDDPLRVAVDAAVATVRSSEQATLAIALAIGREQSGAIAYTVARGETLESIAVRFYGTVQAAPLIALRNELPSNRVHPGDIIWLPVQFSRDAASTLPTPEIRLDPTAVEAWSLGTDLRLVNGDIAHDDEDLILVSGIDLVEQDLAIRLTTVRGTNPIWPHRGVSVTVGDLATPQRLAALARDAFDEILNDERITQCKNLSVVENGSAINVSFTAQVAVDRPLRVSVAIGGT